MAVSQKTIEEMTRNLQLPKNILDTLHKELEEN